VDAARLNRGRHNEKRASSQLKANCEDLTRPELAVSLSLNPGRWPFPGHVCSTLLVSLVARQSGLSRPGRPARR
jgi:hypothetical protein